MISPKDIADMFAELEIYLIQSFKRNLKRHKDWEKDEGFEWSAWQAEKLRELNIFRRQNKTIAKNFISRILPQTRQMLIEQYKEGSDTTPSFFGINERRLNALIDEMLTIEQDVTKAALRNVDDAYRQTVLKAAAARNSGTMTLYQAVDMASKEFLSKGINCVQYKDGRRVNIVSYAEMALRTNATRSRLYGQRAKMKEMGIDTVIISQYGGCSPTCLPWQGKVYIDDVFIDFEGKKGVSWGISNNGNTYMLLSHAMKNGLFHPNCRHNARIYREGITRIPRPLDKDTVNKNYALEQQQHALEREVRKAKRLEEGTLDEENKKEYTAYRKYAQKKLREFIAEHDDVLRRDLWREKHTPGLGGSDTIRDIEEYHDYKNILQGNAPESIEKFLEIKYNDKEKWDYYRGLRTYFLKYPTSDKRFYDVYYRLKEAGIKQGIVLPAKNVQAFILPEGKRDPYHIMHRMLERLVTDDDIRGFMANAKCMFIQWNGNRRVYYSEKGACVVTKSGDDWLFKTAWSKSDYDDTTDTIMEVINKYV